MTDGGAGQRALARPRRTGEPYRVGLPALGVREPPDATGCVACAVAINKAYYGVAMGS